MLVNSPTVISAPQTSSMMPAAFMSGGRFGIAPEGSGNAIIFCVPCSMNKRPTTIRRMLRSCGAHAGENATAIAYSSRTQRRAQKLPERQLHHSSSADQSHDQEDQRYHLGLLQAVDGGPVARVVHVVPGEGETVVVVHAAHGERGR